MAFQFFTIPIQKGDPTEEELLQDSGNRVSRTLSFPNRVSLALS